MKKLRLAAVWPGSRIEGLRTLSPSEVSEFHAANRELATFVQERELYAIFAMNVETLLEFLRTAASEMSTARQTATFDGLRPNANRHVMNILTSMRTYLDHTETTLSHRHGRGSKPLNDFRTLCSRHYDRTFSYRFLYKLRNYAQHCGMPVGDVRSRLVSGGTECLVVSYNRDDLIRDYTKWGDPVKQELPRQPRLINIVRHLGPLARCLTNIERWVARLDAQRVRAHARFLVGLANEVRASRADSDPALLSGTKHRDGSVNLLITSFPPDSVLSQCAGTRGAR